MQANTCLLLGKRTIGLNHKTHGCVLPTGVEEYLCQLKKEAMALHLRMCTQVILCLNRRPVSMVCRVPPPPTRLPSIVG